MKSLCYTLIFGVLATSNLLNAQLTKNYTEQTKYAFGLSIGPQFSGASTTPDSIYVKQALVGRYVGAYVRFNIEKAHAFIRFDGSQNSFKLRMLNENDEKLEFDGNMFELAPSAGFYLGKKALNLQAFAGPAFSISAYKFKPSDRSFTISSENEKPLISQFRAGLTFERAPMQLTIAYKQDLNDRVVKSLVESQPIPDNERMPYGMRFIEFTFGIYL